MNYQNVTEKLQNAVTVTSMDVRGISVIIKYEIHNHMKFIGHGII